MVPSQAGPDLSQPYDQDRNHCGETVGPIELAQHTDLREETARAALNVDAGAWQGLHAQYYAWSGRGFPARNRPRQMSLAEPYRDLRVWFLKLKGVMRKIILASALMGLGALAACDANEEPDEINITVEEPDTLSENFEEAGEAIEDGARHAAEEIEAAGDEAEAAVNDAGEAMTEPTDNPQ